MSDLPTFTAKRYVQPMREGGSMPAVVDTDGGLFVVKFRGAGQGPRALVAEAIVGLLAQELGLPVPDVAVVDVPSPFGKSEPDPEIQHILEGSHGVNIGLRYLDGAFNFDGSAAGELIAADLAARIVWLDALVTNPDRTHRNPNILIWERGPWLIDHGAALYAHHDWPTVDDARTRTAFPLIRQHVLLGRAGDLAAADAALAPVLSEAVIARVLAHVPDALLAGPRSLPRGPVEAAGFIFDSADAARERYADYFATRLRPPRVWVDEATRARETARTEPPRRLSARR